MAYPYTVLYADDVVIMAETREALEAKVIIWKNELAQYGSKSESQKKGIHGIWTKPLAFKYLGSYLSYEGGVTTNVSAKIQTAWQKWKTLSGVLCDKKLPRKLISKVYCLPSCPAVLYGSECWAITKKDEQRLSVMETTMLRRTIGISRLGQTPNEMVGRSAYGEQSQIRQNNYYFTPR
ncbi:hypothetical protein M514_21395 [Trichuris suis]|uniref:Reverse transcriptase domain-containing protein n=1 Tax=Trichuris suis TaxID=68888 RepID=A0A085NA69_9BILA|nr:hypothetical protein M514_21395 [Trichuris suis]